MATFQAGKLLLKFARESYRRGASKLSDANMRKEYTRLRDIAEKRLKVMRRHPQLSKSDVYGHEIKHGFPTLSQIDSRDELEYYVNKVIGFNQDIANTTPSGYKKWRAATIKGLQEHGFESVNEQTFDAFGDFMSEWRALGTSIIISSEDAARMAKAAVEKVGRKLTADEMDNILTRYSAQFARDWRKAQAPKRRGFRESKDDFELRKSIINAAFGTGDEK